MPSRPAARMASRARFQQTSKSGIGGPVLVGEGLPGELLELGFEQVVGVVVPGFLFGEGGLEGAEHGLDGVVVVGEAHLAELDAGGWSVDCVLAPGHIELAAEDTGVEAVDAGGAAFAGF